jgi:hypothetical protein
MQAIVFSPLPCLLHERGAAEDVVFPFWEVFGAHEDGWIESHLVLERQLGGVNVLARHPIPDLLDSLSVNSVVVFVVF